MNVSQEQFEAWAQTQCMQLKKDGVVVTYAYERTDLAWQAWMASRKAIAIPLPEFDEPEYHSPGTPDWHSANGYNNGVEECQKAIEAVGLKTE